MTSGQTTYVADNSKQYNNSSYLNETNFSDHNVEYHSTSSNISEMTEKTSNISKITDKTSENVGEEFGNLVKAFAKDADKISENVQAFFNNICGNNNVDETFFSAKGTPEVPQSQENYTESTLTRSVSWVEKKRNLMKPLKNL